MSDLKAKMHQNRFQLGLRTDLCEAVAKLYQIWGEHRAIMALTNVLNFSG